VNQHDAPESRSAPGPVRLFFYNLIVNGERVAPSRDFRALFESLPWLAAASAGAIYLLSLTVVRSTFRFFSRCQFNSLRLEHLPEKVSAEFRRRVSEFADLGFELLGCFDCGALANDTHSYMACCSNLVTNEIATVWALITPLGPASYFEFSSRFSESSSIATNTNGILSR
jgi:hypothetical protein